MDNLMINAKDLNFNYFKSAAILKNINLQVPRGSVYGFIGPNGSGKTTTIKLLLGLLKSQNDNIFVLGKSIKNCDIEIFSKVGSLIETPSLYEHLTAFENILINCKIRNVSKSRIRDVLAMVKLLEQRDIKVKKFSLGMKQRMGIALALVSNPELLILDEPTNGLDPYGIVDIRHLISKLNSEFGTTVLVSSHLLSEVEKIVTNLGIISRGEIIFQGTQSELHEFRTNKGITRFRTNDNEKASFILGNEFSLTKTRDGAFEVGVMSDKDIAMICKLLFEHGLDIFQVQTFSNDLEDIFFQLTMEQNEQNDSTFIG